MPLQPEARPSPPQSTNPYRPAHQRHPDNQNCENPITPQNRTQQNLHHWLHTARNNPVASPNYLPANRPTHQWTTQRPRQRQNHRTPQTPDTPQTPTEPTNVSQPNTQPDQQTLPTYTGIQTSLGPPTDNAHWGDPLHPMDPNSFRIISKNINSLPTTDSFVQWRAATAAGKETRASVMCFQETNLRWDNNNHMKVAQIFIQSYNVVKISVSSSDEPSAKEYQPGGTFTATLGPWTSRVIHTGSDASGLGRWSYITLRLKEPKKLTIVSGYRVCDQNPSLGSRTSYNQQLRLLMAAGHYNPDPRKQFFMDLILSMQQW